MKLETHRRAAELFASLCELSQAGQADALARLRVDEPDAARLLEELLVRDRSLGSPLDRPASQEATPLSAAAPARVGAYRIVRRVGSGGMGVVYEAEHEPTQRRVALKLLRPGYVTPELLARFEREAQLLARLNHPGIAHVYEAGTATTDFGAQPYFAMELVRGESLTVFVEQRRASVRERVELLARVCDAVRHAHEHGVIHRDLKPSNVLVDESGQPRVLDFGVARATHGSAWATSLRTEVGQLVGTLAYTSPEQIRADPSKIDERADVHALGVLAYELLAGRVPFDVHGLPLHDAARAIVERDAAPLGALDRRCRGDLETIVGKCLEKDRDRRYASAAELGADLRRWLADQPIVARPASASYRVAKFARRNRVLVSSACAVFAALTAGMIASTRMYLRAEDAREAEHSMRTRAEDSAATLRATNAYFLEFFAAPTPWTEGTDVRVVDVLARAAPKIEGAFPDHPLRRAGLLSTVGQTYARLGRWSESRRLLEQALTLTREHSPQDGESIGNLEQSLAMTLTASGDLDAARAHSERALATLGEDEPTLRRATFHGTLARALAALDRYAEAEVEARRALEIVAGDPSVRIGDEAFEHVTLAEILIRRGRIEEAEQVCREVIDALLAESDEPRADLMSACHTLAEALMRLGRADEAIPWLRRSLEGQRKLAGDDHPDVTTQVANLGVLLGDIGRFDEAEPLLREAVARAKAHGDARQLAFKQSNLATVLRREGHVAEAIDLLREAERSLSENENPRGMRRAWVLWRLGQALFDAGELTACVDVLRESLEIHRDLFGPGQEEIAIVESWLGSALVARGDYADAAEHLDAALDIHRDLGGPDGAGALEVSRDLAVALAGLGRTCEALELAEGAWEIVRVRNAQDAVVLALHRADLGWCALRAGQLERAAQLSGDTLEALVEHFGDEHPYVVRQRWRMGELEAARASTLR